MESKAHTVQGVLERHISETAELSIGRIEPYHWDQFLPQ